MKAGENWKRPDTGEHRIGRRFYEHPGMWLLPLLFWGWNPVEAESGPSLEKMREDLRGDLRLHLRNGRQHEGRITDWDGEKLRMRVSLGEGEAVLGFNREKIERLEFPGSEHLDTLQEWMERPEKRTQTIALFRAFYQQKGPYFELLDESELRLFATYAEYALEHNHPTAAVAMARVLRPHVEDGNLRRELEDGLLLGFHRSGMGQKAENEARKWIRRADPAGSSALGWRVLAELFFEAERYEDTFWAALHPVAFSSDLPMEHLDVCYAYAVAAADELNWDGESKRLAQEMLERNFPWPRHIRVLRERTPPSFVRSSANPPESTSTGETPENEEPENGAPDEQDGDAESEAAEPDPPENKKPDPGESLPTRIRL